MNTYRVGDQKSSGVNLQTAKDDVGISQSFQAKKKKGASDPRFKRIISSEIKKNSETDATKNNLPVVADDQQIDGEPNDKVISLIKAPKNTNEYPKGIENAVDNSSPDSADVVTKDPGLQVSDPVKENSNAYLKKNEKNFKSSGKTMRKMKTDLKKSASDCTLHKKKPYGNEDDEDLQQIRPCPSGFQLTSRTLLERDCKPDKRRSVVTVIGQTQTKPFNEVLQEINRRRKLAKELDKHALCEGIMESNETQEGVKNLVAKVDFVLPDGKVIYSTEKIYLSNDKQDCLECLALSKDNLEDEFKKRRDMIPERDSSVSQIERRSRPKRWSKKLMASAKEGTQLKEKIKYLKPKLFCLLLLIVFLTYCIFVAVDVINPMQTYYSFYRIFAPKSATWYEKLLY